MADPATYRPKPGSIPTQPGVYRFRDKDGRVIYVGKAKSLRARLSSYFQDLANLHARTQTMVTTAASVEWTVVGTEVEALQLEYSWIKEFDPRFNVKYRDDKSYPWLAITMNEEYPRVMVGRGAKSKGVKYFGPYSHAWAIRDTVDTLLRVFPMRSCSNGVFKRSGQIGRPCLLGYIDKCSAPCVGRVDADEHRAIAEDFADFMGGRTDQFLKRVEREMYAASEAQDYEKAAMLRDDLGALHKALEKQAVVFGDGTDADVIALAEDPLEVAVQIFHVRSGRIRGQRGWVADRVEDLDTGGLVSEFLLQLYAGEDPDAIPREILVPAMPDDAETFEQLLGESRGSKVSIRVPAAGRQAHAAGDRRAERRPVAGAAQDAARERPDRAQPGAGGDPAGARAARRPAAHRVLRHLPPPGQRDRRLDGGLRGRAGAQERVPPVRDPQRRGVQRRRLDARGDHPAVPAAARRAHRDTGPDGGEVNPDDPAGPLLVDPDTGRPKKFAYTPGLVVVDGGPPQVAATQRALDELGIDDIPVVGLAKRLEEVWLPGQADPVILPRSSEGLYLLQRIRDEAHRFAITHHRSRRSRSMVESLLDDVQGLGEVRRKTLIKHFGSLKKLRAATIEEIAEVPGIGRRTATAISEAVAASPKPISVNTATGEIQE